MSKNLAMAATMTMVLSIIFGATGNTSLMYALTAFAGAETIFALVVAYKSKSFRPVSAQELWIYSILIVIGTAATFMFTFPAGLPLFVPAFMAIFRNREPAGAASHEGSLMSGGHVKRS